MTSDTPNAVCGTVGLDGRLLSADSRLLALQLAAGGEAEGVIAVPQLASLVRLARTLGVVVSRAVVAADRDVDLDLWVRAEPQGDVIRLAIAGWTVRTAKDYSAAHLAERAATLAEQGTDGHWSTDATLRMTALDGDLAQLIPTPWLGERMTRLFMVRQGDDGAAPLIEGILDDEAFTGQQARLICDDTVEIWLHGAPVKNEAGIVTGYQGGFRWASARPATLPPPKQLADSIGADDPLFVDRLDQALRRPLARIITEADAIRAQDSGPLKPDYAGYAGDIGVAGRHLLGLVDDLSDLQAVERVDFNIETERLDLADVARRAANLLGVRAADQQVQIDAPESDEQLWAQADFRRALQIMVNLVGNAVRYSPSGSMVWIRAEQEGDLAALVVADQGKGIAPDDHERIFGKFERVDISEPGGSGLGLYISRRLARAMGGDITVDSAPGIGARFILTLPAA